MTYEVRTENSIKYHIVRCEASDIKNGQLNLTYLEENDDGDTTLFRLASPLHEAVSAATGTDVVKLILPDTNISYTTGGDFSFDMWIGLDEGYSYLDNHQIEIYNFRDNVSLFVSGGWGVIKDERIKNLNYKWYRTNNLSDCLQNETIASDGDTILIATQAFPTVNEIIGYFSASNDQVYDITLNNIDNYVYGYLMDFSEIQNITSYYESKNCIVFKNSGFKTLFFHYDELSQNVKNAISESQRTWMQEYYNAIETWRQANPLAQ